MLSFDDVVFLKRGFLDRKNDILLKTKHLHILKGVNPCFWSEVPNIFRAYISLKQAFWCRCLMMLFSQNEAF